MNAETGGGLTAEVRCTCGPNGTVDECDCEVAAGGWCPNRDRLNRYRAALHPAPSEGGGE
jgi:hypothetical protein